jgi:hypothetical protein
MKREIQRRKSAAKAAVTERAPSSKAKPGASRNRAEVSAPRTARTRERTAAKVKRPAPCEASEDAVYVGWARFRDNGGAVLAEVAKTERECAVGTGRASLHLRLRPEANHQAEADKVREEHKLRFDAAKEQWYQFRTLVALGVPFLLKSKGGSRVLVDRHPDYEHDLIDAHLKRMRSSARRQVWKEVVAILQVLQKSRKGRKIDDQRDQPREGAPRLPENLQRVLNNLLEVLDREGVEVESFVKSVMRFDFARGADAEVNRKTVPTEKDLDGFRRT